MEAFTLINTTGNISQALLKFHSSTSALSCRKNARFLESSSRNSSRGALIAKNVAIRGLQATEISKDEYKISRPPPSPRPLEDAGKVPPAPLMKVAAESLQYEAGFLGGVSEKTRAVPDNEKVPMAISYLTSVLSSRQAEGLVLYSVGIHTEVELKAMKDRMASSGLKTIDLTDNDLAKDHLRNLMGGRADVENELICRFVFPERPGALMKFLDTFSPRWNISLFHYRAQGEMGANVLVGMQIPEFSARACTLGYEYEDERHNEALKLLLTKLA